jgi:hypothetical protein
MLVRIKNFGFVNKGMINFLVAYGFDIKHIDFLEQLKTGRFKNI